MSKIKEEALSPEWSYLIDADSIDDKPVKLSISPNAEEKRALLPRLGVTEIEQFKADLTLKRQKMVLHVSGHLSAKIVQDCVVSFQPIKSEINEDFEAWFADPEQAVSIAKARREKQMKKGAHELPMLDESEDPEHITDGKVDLGELAVQYLSLSINPYPHAPGVAYEIGDDSPADEASIARKNPFAVLKDWKDKLK